MHSPISTGHLPPIRRVRTLVEEAHSRFLNMSSRHQINALIFIIGVSALLLNSCSLRPPIREGERAVLFHRKNPEFYDPARLTRENRDLLERMGLIRLYRKNPDLAISRVSEAQSKVPARLHRFLLSEMLIDQAAGEDDWRNALGYRLEAGRLAWLQIAADREDDPVFRNVYNFTCGEVLLALQSKAQWEKEVVVPGIGGRELRLRSDLRGKNLIDPRNWNEIWLAEDWEFSRMRKLNRIIVPGIGAPLVGYMDHENAEKQGYEFVSPVGLSAPFTAVVRSAAGTGDFELAIYDSDVVTRVRMDGREYPLQIDYTAPIALLAKFQPYTAVGLRGFLRPQRFLDRMGLFHIDRYDPERIPLVFVHGLMSSPGVWLETINALRADPEIRRKYQVVLFYYPNGLPILFNASGLRESLAEYSRRHDPDRDRPNFRKIVLVGHSMGSILANAQVRSSNGVIENFVFRRPIEQLADMTPEEKEHVKRLVRYRANPDVTRTVFIAGPHRGSPFATNIIGRIGSRLISFPFDLILPGKSLTADLTPQARRILHSRPNSVSSLAPNSPVLDLILQQPVKRHLHVHSIIGRLNPNIPLEESSDGIVPYPSAHLAGVDSEVVVTAEHTATVSRPDTIAELRRILSEHAEK